MRTARCGRAFAPAGDEVEREVRGALNRVRDEAERGGDLASVGGAVRRTVGEVEVRR